MSLFYHIIQPIYLILQQEPLSFFKKGQSLIHKFRFVGLIRSAVQNNTVLPSPLHLDNRTSAAALYPPDKTGVHTASAASLQQRIAVFPCHPSMEHTGSGLCKRNGLVQPLPPAENLQTGRSYSFTGSYNVLHMVGIVQIQRTVI